MIGHRQLMASAPTRRKLHWRNKTGLATPSVGYDASARHAERLPMSTRLPPAPTATPPFPRNEDIRSWTARRHPNARVQAASRSVGEACRDQYL